MMHTVEEQAFELPGITIQARCWRAHQPRRQILALHGWMDNANSFYRIAPQWPGTTTIAIDMAGHGRSDHRPAGVPYHVVDYVKDAFGVLSQLPKELPTIVMGHSLGAGIASYLAAIAPDRVQQCVLIEGLGTLTTEAEDAPEVLRQAAEDWTQPATRSKRSYPDQEKMIALRQHGLNPVSLESAKALCERATVETDEGWQWRNDSRLRATSPLRLTEDLCEAFLKRIKMPSLMVMGTSGLPSVRPEYNRRLALIPRLQVVTLQGGHHLHMDESADQVAAEIHQFIEKHN